MNASLRVSPSGPRRALAPQPACGPDGSAAVLYARRDSIYKTMRACDVFDIDRDARTWQGGASVIAHPPCRSWGRLRMFAKPAPHEKALAMHAVEAVRRWGGVLEHPECSSLWAAAGLPRPGKGYDAAGGWTLCIDQYWFGHRARKRTWLYIVGVQPQEIPAFPIVLGNAPCVVSRSGRGGSMKPLVSKAEREHTPTQLAIWLVALVAGGRA